MEVLKTGEKKSLKRTAKITVHGHVIYFNGYADADIKGYDRGIVLFKDGDVVMVVGKGLYSAKNGIYNRLIKIIKRNGDDEK